MERPRSATAGGLRARGPRRRARPPALRAAHDPGGGVRRPGRRPRLRGRGRGDPRAGRRAAPHRHHDARRRRVPARRPRLPRHDRARLGQRGAAPDDPQRPRLPDARVVARHDRRRRDRAPGRRCTSTIAEAIAAGDEPRASAAMDAASQPRAGQGARARTHTQGVANEGARRARPAGISARTPCRRRAERFADGGAFRVEIPSVEGPEAMAAVLDAARAPRASR